MNSKLRTVCEVLLWALLLFALNRPYTILAFAFEALTWEQILMILKDPSSLSIQIKSKSWPSLDQIIIIVLMVPFIETFVNQFFVVTLCIRKFSERNTILISGFIFGICHYAVYSHSGVIAATLHGFLYAFLFIRKNQKNGVVFAYFYVAAIHSLFNFMALMI